MLVVKLGGDYDITVIKETQETPITEILSPTSKINHQFYETHINHNFALKSLTKSTKGDNTTSIYLAFKQNNEFILTEINIYEKNPYLPTYIEYALDETLSHLKETIDPIIRNEIIYQQFLDPLP